MKLWDFKSEFKKWPEIVKLRSKITFEIKFQNLELILFKTCGFTTFFATNFWNIRTYLSVSNSGEERCGETDQLHDCFVSVFVFSQKVCEWRLHRNHAIFIRSRASGRPRRLTICWRETTRDQFTKLLDEWDFSCKRRLKRDQNHAWNSCR